MFSRSPLRGRRVVIHTKRPDDQTIAGVLVSTRHGLHALHDAEYVVAEKGEVSKHPLEHPVHIPTANIAWIEELA